MSLRVGVRITGDPYSAGYLYTDVFKSAYIDCDIYRIKCERLRAIVLKTGRKQRDNSSTDDISERNQPAENDPSQSTTPLRPHVNRCRQFNDH